MKIFRNDRLIARNSKIGQWISLAALIVLGVGMYISFARQELLSYALICLALGFILTQISMYMGKRWGRSPRPDELLDAGLKGLHSDFHMYHYLTPTSHLLVGPAGIWVLMPYHQRGKVEYRNKRWHLSGGGLLQGYLRLFGQEGLGKPEADAQAEIHSITRFLSRETEHIEIPEVYAALIFTDDQLELNPDGSPLPAMKLKRMKEFFRQKSKDRVLPSELLQAIASSLPN